MDRRKFNGGNSTKSKGIDKRKNPYKNVINKTLTADKVESVLNMLYNKAIKEEDVNAAKILLEYALGKPTQSIDHTTDGDKIKTPIFSSNPLNE